MRHAPLLLVLSLGCATQPLAASDDPTESATARAVEPRPSAEPSTTSGASGDAARKARPSSKAKDAAHVIAGMTPESGPHSWGSRTFEVTRVAGGPWRVRVHDEMFFQGAGMRPEQRPEPTHRCTAWSDVPDDVATRANLSGLDFTQDRPIGATATEGALRAWLEQSAPEVTDVLGNLAFGRRFEPC